MKTKSDDGATLYHQLLSFGSLGHNTLEWSHRRYYYA